MDLVALPDVPVPTGAISGQVVTRDGIRLRYARFEPTGVPRKGTVTIAQGRAEFIEKYFEVIGNLRSRGFTVIAFDWRGQGGSDRLTSNIRKGHVRRFSDYQIDLETIMNEVALVHGRPPHFALGHSMGGTILIEAAKAGRPWFDRMVLSAPMVLIEQAQQPWAPLLLARALSLLGLGAMIAPGDSAQPMTKKPFANNIVTSDPARYARAAAYADIDPRLGLGGPTIAWVREALKATIRLTARGYGDDVTQPILMIAAGDDRLIHTQATERLGDDLRAGHTIVVRGARHELMMERDHYREQFFAAFDAFVPGEKMGL